MINKPKRKIQRSFFTDSDVVNIAKSLIGNFLFSNVDGVLTGGTITETEAYRGHHDLAMEKHLLRRPSSITTLKKQGGVAYIYTIYGSHSMLNIVTNDADHTDSVLIRKIKPTEGVDKMRERRGMKISLRNLCDGPAKLTQALAITPALNGEPVLNNTLIWIEQSNHAIASKHITSSHRIGIDYAKDDQTGKLGARDDTTLPWRFTLK